MLAIVEYENDLDSIAQIVLDSTHDEELKRRLSQIFPFFHAVLE